MELDNNGGVTIYDVARQAGVSTATVSRVLNDHPYVRSQLRSRIQTIILDLGFVPSQTARRLSMSRSSIRELTAKVS